MHFSPVSDRFLLTCIAAAMQQFSALACSCAIRAQAESASSSDCSSMLKDFLLPNNFSAFFEYEGYPGVCRIWKHYPEYPCPPGRHAFPRSNDHRFVTHLKCCSCRHRHCCLTFVTLPSIEDFLKNVCTHTEKVTRRVLRVFCSSKKNIISFVRTRFVFCFFESIVEGSDRLGCFGVCHTHKQLF